MRIYITHIKYNPLGPDVPKEYIEISSEESVPVNLKDWTTRDRAGHIYKFPDFNINPGRKIKVWTKVGTDDEDNLYCDRRKAVWNNEGDKATLRDAAGKIVDSYRYPLRMAPWNQFGVATKNGRVWIADIDQDGKEEVIYYNRKNGLMWVANYRGGKLEWSVLDNCAGFGDLLRTSIKIWLGDFSGNGAKDFLFYCADDGNWNCGRLYNELNYTDKVQLEWSLVSNNTDLGNLLRTGIRIWMGDFTGSGRTKLLLYRADDGDWFMGNFDKSPMNWEPVNNAIQYGDLLNDNIKTWTGDFSGSGRTELLFFNADEGNWYISSYDGTQLNWTLAGNSAEYGNLLRNIVKIWTGDFTGSGRTELLFYRSDDENWFIGSFDGAQLNWVPAGNSTQFGKLLRDGVGIWIGNFTGSGRTEVLFYCADDGNWSIGTFNGTNYDWELANNCLGFGSLLRNSIKIWTGDLTGGGQTELLFYCADDGNWWHGTFAGKQLSWRLGAETYAQEDKSILDLLVYMAGFEFDWGQRIFYSRLDPWQQNVGYFTLYDVAAPLSLMFIECEPILFKYGGKSWKIELWKGQYGICTGAEIGIYTGEFQVNTGVDAIDHTLNQLNFGDDTNCAGDDDMLEMSFKLKKGKSVVFERSADKHWWLTGFKPAEFSSGSDLKMEIEITMKDYEMRDAFVAGLVKLGYPRGDIKTNETKVSFTYDRPYSKQPW